MKDFRLVMMKIAAFCERFWPEGSGGELATYLILELLASTRDFEIEIYTGTQDPVRIPGVSIKKLDFLEARSKTQLYFSILKNKRGIEKIVEKVDVVYIPRISYPIIPIAKSLSKKVVVHIHGYQPVSYTATVFSTELESPMSDFKRTFIFRRASGNMLKAVVLSLTPLLTRLNRTWVNMADRILCVSRRHEEILLKLAPEYKGKTTVVYNPPPRVPHIEKNLSEKPTFLYVGGDSYVKGFHVLLEAIKNLGRRQVKFKFILTNRYSRKSLRAIEHLRMRFDLDIKVLGLVSYEELISLHSQAWALIFPSIWEEPLPYAVIEALLLSTIPIASMVGGVPELLSGYPGEVFLVKPGCPESVASKLLEIASTSIGDILFIGKILKESLKSRLDVNSIKNTLIKVFTTL